MRAAWRGGNKQTHIGLGCAILVGEKGDSTVSSSIESPGHNLVSNQRVSLKALLLLQLLPTWAISSAADVGTYSISEGQAVVESRNGGYWWSGFFGMGLDNVVYDLVVYSGNLVAVGAFTTAGGVPANRVAAWNGIEWLPMGSGFNNGCRAAVVFNNDLIVGGYFTQADGQPTTNIARWDGSQWNGMGHFDGNVFALYVFQGDLIAGGTFTRVDQRICPYIARWDGQEWHALGLGLNAFPNAICEYQGQLIAGGAFTESGTHQLNHVAHWDGLQWYPLGEGFDDDVSVLDVFDNKLVAGGKFVSSGSTPIDYLAQWDGGSWSQVDEGLEYHASMLYPHQEDLYVGGQFTEVNGIACNRIVRWDGDQWHALGTGLNHYPKAVLHHQDGLYVGGLFTEAGGLPSSKIALWIPPEPTGLEESDEDASTLQLRAFPNPFNPTLTVSFRLEERQRVRASIYDLSGRKLTILIDQVLESGSHELSWDGRDDKGREQSSGVYPFILQVDESQTSEKLVLLR